MTSRRNRHRLEEKWNRNGVFFTLCSCGKLFKTEEGPGPAREAHDKHRREQGAK